MQHNENNQPGGFRRFWQEKGYYIVLSLCILAVGISGYVFVSDAIAQNRAAKEETLSVPVTATEPPAEPAKTAKPTVPTELEPAEEPQQPTAAASVPAEAELLPVEKPVDRTVMPVSGSITHDYAMDHLTYNSTTQDWRVHNGVDLAAEDGQNVAAARAGTVTAVYSDDVYGTTVVVQHADGYATHYCNLSANTAVSAGEHVEAGDILGTVGLTALMEIADEPHLHFEVYRNGNPMNPADFLD